MILQAGETNIKATGVKVTIPNDPYAKLMYYISCICGVLPLEKIVPSISIYKNSANYYQLSQQQKNQLVQIALLLNPSILNGKCIFLAPQLCINCSNQFYQISQLQNTIAIVQSIIIGGSSLQVTKIMTYTTTWITNNFLNPMIQIKQRNTQKKQLPQIKYYSPPPPQVKKVTPPPPRPVKKVTGCCSLI